MGELLIFVRGLVFTNDPSVPPELRGKDDETQFWAVVSCLTPDGLGGVSTVNVTTGGFPATPSGNSIIDTQIDPPDPCIAPISFVSRVGGKWFALTGFESADED